MEILINLLFFYIKTFFMQLYFLIRVVVFSIGNISEIFFSQLCLILFHDDCKFVDFTKGIIIVLTVVPNELKIIKKLVNIFKYTFLEILLHNLNAHWFLNDLWVVLNFKLLIVQREHKFSGFFFLRNQSENFLHFLLIFLSDFNCNSFLLLHYIF